jgi:hypothetical protein
VGLNVEVGTKLSPGATGVQTYSLTAGFGTPKALIVWASNQAATGTQTAWGQFGHGWATYRGGVAQMVSATSLIDPSNTASRDVVFGGNIATAVLLRMFNVLDATTTDWEVSLDSFSTDAWAINWTNLPATGSTFLHYIVLGGTDITDAIAGEFTTAFTPTTPETVALPAGFGQPDLIAFRMNPGGSSTTLSTTSDATYSLGWAVSDTERAAVVMADNDAATTMAAASWAKARALVALDSTATAAIAELDLSARAGWPTDGFQVAWPDLPAGASALFYLALKGTFEKKILESRTTATATGNQDHDVGFAPKLAINWGHVMPSAQTIQRAAQNADATMFWHGATDGTNQAVAGISQDDGKATSFGRSYAFDNQTLHAAEAVAAATRAQATGSFSGNNVRLNYGTANATGRQFHLLALGDAAGAAPAEIPIVVTARSRP